MRVKKLRFEIRNHYKLISDTNLNTGVGIIAIGVK